MLVFWNGVRSAGVAEQYGICWGDGEVKRQTIHPHHVAQSSMEYVGVTEKGTDNGYRERGV